MSELKSTHILLVEDTMTQALMMQHLLESQNFKVSIAKDCYKALDFLKAETPDLILSDVSLPEMDGYELCRRLKSDQATKAIPFILMSSFHDASEIVNIVNCGADSFMLKRFEQKYVSDGLTDILTACGAKSSLNQRELPLQSEPLTVMLEGTEHNLTGGSADQLATMLFSAFRTMVHLIPLVEPE
jgi:DNA-binding response OmpR family regulator